MARVMIDFTAMPWGNARHYNNFPIQDETRHPTGVFSKLEK